MLWLAIAAITLVAVGVLLLPLFRRGDGTASRAERELAIYRDQLAELQRDLAAGRISATEAKGAEIEIQRRLLASSAGSDAAADVPRTRAAGARNAAAAAILAFVPLGALLAYLAVGTPAGDPTADDIDAMIATLAERMARNPEIPRAGPCSPGPTG